MRQQKCKYPRISVLMLTYNQEKSVLRALNSLLRQKEFIYEVCINDDCSTDGTFEVLKQYEAKYPEFFKPVRNSENLGIFRNIEELWKRPSGDIVYLLAGDDEVGDGWFRTVLEYIENNGIDWQNDAFCIYGDFMRIYPDGTRYPIYNSALTSRKDAFRLAVRGLIENRSACASIAVYRKFVSASDGRSYSVEMAQDRQLQLFSEKNYYIPQVGNVYYASVGVSANINEQRFEERLKIGEYLTDFLKGLGIEMKASDRAYLQYKKYTHLVSRKPFFANLCKLFYWYMRAFDPTMFYPGRMWKKIVFKLKRK